MHLKSRVERILPILGAGEGSQRGSRNRGDRVFHRAHALNQLVAVLARHGNIRKQHVRRLTAQHLDGF